MTQFSADYFLQAMECDARAPLPAILYGNFLLERGHSDDVADRFFNAVCHEVRAFLFLPSYINIRFFKSYQNIPQRHAVSPLTCAALGGVVRVYLTEGFRTLHVTSATSAADISLSVFKTLGISDASAVERGKFWVDGMLTCHRTIGICTKWTSIGM